MSSSQKTYFILSFALITHLQDQMQRMISSHETQLFSHEVYVDLRQQDAWYLISWLQKEPHCYACYSKLQLLFLIENSVLTYFSHC